MTKDKIYLTQEGYNQYVQEIEELHSKLSSSSRDKSDSYRSAVGDGWHDNFAFESAKREELTIIKQLEEKISGLGRIVIIDDELDDNLDVIQIGDVVQLVVNTPTGKSVEQIIKLIGSENIKADVYPKEISINSPLGSAIYGKQIGEEISYTVNSKELSALIKSKINEKDYNADEQTSVVKKR